MANYVGLSTSRRKGHKVIFVMPANSSENVQSFQRNDGPEPATIARDRSLQPEKSKGPVIWSRVPETTLPLRQLYRAFICENVVPVGRVKVNPA